MTFAEFNWRKPEGCLILVLTLMTQILVLIVKLLIFRCVIPSDVGDSGRLPRTYDRFLNGRTM